MLLEVGERGGLLSQFNVFPHLRQRNASPLCYVGLDAQESLKREALDLEDFTWTHDISIRCYFCGDEEETLNHLFTGCSYSQELWTQFVSRIHCAIGSPDSVVDLIRHWHGKWAL